MNKKWLFGIILIITIITVIVICMFTTTTRYNKLVISNAEWANIINNKEESTDISIKSIKFNDYNLLIDNSNNTIYYSVVNSKSKYNPLVSYTTSNKNIKITINNKIDDDHLESNDYFKILIYNDTSYRIYSLVVTKLPILSIENNDSLTNQVDVTLFDNSDNAFQRVIKSNGHLNHKNKKEYTLTLSKESVGHNTRPNHISIFGMDRSNKYQLQKIDTMNNKHMIHLFIDNKYIGIYLIEPKLGGNINKYENR